MELSWPKWTTNTEWIPRWIECWHTWTVRNANRMNKTKYYNGDYDLMTIELRTVYNLVLMVAMSLIVMVLFIIQVASMSTHLAPIIQSYPIVSEWVSEQAGKQAVNLSASMRRHRMSRHATTTRIHSISPLNWQRTHTHTHTYIHPQFVFLLLLLVRCVLFSFAQSTTDMFQLEHSTYLVTLNF